MSNLIDLFDIKTYSQEFININMLNESGLELDYYEVDNLLSGFYIKCTHTTRVYDKSMLEQCGLLRPFVVDDNESEKYHIVDKLKNFVFEPYKKLLSNKRLDDMKNSYDNYLIKEYMDNRTFPFDDYYGKFSIIHFTYDNLDRATTNDFNGYKNFLLYQGGELFDTKISNLVTNSTKPYVIFFKVKISDLPSQIRNELYNNMARVYLKKEFEVYPLGYINKDIPSSDIIEIKELTVSE